MKKKGIMKKMTAVFLSAAMAVSLAACGNTSNDKEDQTSTDSTFVYVPRWINISGGGEDTSMGDFRIGNEKLFYSYASYTETETVHQYRALDLNNIEGEPEVVYEGMSGEEIDGFVTYVTTVFVDDDGNILMLQLTQPVIDYETATQEDYVRVQEQCTFSLRKLNADGSEGFLTDLTDLFREAQVTHAQQLAVDGEGNAFVSSGEGDFWIFDGQGTYVNKTNVTSGDWTYIRGMMKLNDGSMAILLESSGESVIKTYDASKNEFSNEYKGLPADCYNSDLALGTDGKILLRGENCLYEYDMETQSFETLITWIDCDINADYVNFTGVLPDGNILVGYSDWNVNEDSLIVLEKKSASEVVEKEIITLGTISASQATQAAVVNFNKNSEKYRIQLKDYTASLDWSQENASEQYQDAIVQFKNDIMTGNGPDLFTADDIDLELFAANGLIEDLNPYLDNSQVVDRDNLFESVLNVYTIDGTLCMIPDSFAVLSLFGRQSELGDRTGWTLNEMIEFANQYPDMVLYPFASNTGIIYDMLCLASDTYVDWSTGECNFDSDDFKRLLEFANQYTGKEPDYSSNEAQMLMNREALLSNYNIANPQNYQVLSLLFGEAVTTVGFPTADGTGSGVAVQGNNGICINAASKNKEAAWSFIESVLSEEDSIFNWGFSNSKSEFEASLAEAMTAEYETDAAGNPVLDENGDPIEVSHYSYGWDDIELRIYSLSEEDAQQIRDLINSIDSVYSWNTDLMAIIEEEVTAYFEGQKSVDEVTDIIQSRAKIYINENR